MPTEDQNNEPADAATSDAGHGSEPARGADDSADSDAGETGGPQSPTPPEREAYGKNLFAHAFDPPELSEGSVTIPAAPRPPVVPPQPPREQESDSAGIEPADSAPRVEAPPPSDPKSANQAPLAEPPVPADTLDLTQATQPETLHHAEQPSIEAPPPAEAPPAESPARTSPAEDVPPGDGTEAAPLYDEPSGAAEPGSDGPEDPGPASAAPVRPPGRARRHRDLYGMGHSPLTSEQLPAREVQARQADPDVADLSAADTQVLPIIDRPAKPAARPDAAPAQPVRQPTQPEREPVQRAQPVAQPVREPVRRTQPAEPARQPVRREQSARQPVPRTRPAAQPLRQPIRPAPAPPEPSTDFPAVAEPIHRRWPKVLALTAIPLVLLLAMAAAGIGWYYSNEILTVTRSEDPYDVEVVAVRDDVVVLSGEGVDHPQITGLEWDGGYARLLPGAEATERGVLREFEPFPDVPEPGTSARLDFYAAPDDLAGVTELGAQQITVDAPIGALDATYVPGDHGRWVILVHGRGASQAETFRLVPQIATLGYPSLAISYRNDVGAPQDPDGWWGLGWTESEDLAAAVDYAVANGAEDVVLVGYSMGGAIIGNYLRTEGDGHVAGVIYDSPLLSWTDTINVEAADRGLPSVLTSLASVAIRVRAGIDLGELDQVEHAERLTVPTLVIHGTGDETVPVASSDAFAEARNDLVTYLRLEGAGHVQGWNSHRSLYEDAVAEFLTGLG